METSVAVGYRGSKECCGLKVKGLGVEGVVGGVEREVIRASTSPVGGDIDWLILKFIFELCTIQF